MDSSIEHTHDKTLSNSTQTKDSKCGLRKHHTDLTMNEILHLLRPKVQPGHQLPSELSAPPWLINEINNNSIVINKLLRKSWESQSSTIPECDGHGDFSDFIVSNSSLAIAGLLTTYLKTLNINNVSLVFGIALWDKATQNDEVFEDYEGTPQVWLDVEGNDIDNAYVDIPTSDDITIDFIYNLRKLNKYVRENPWKTKHKLYLDQESQTATMSQTLHNLKIFREYHNVENFEKYLVFTLSYVELNPTVKMYDILMRHFLKTQFDVEPEDLAAKWSKKCWACGKEKNKEELKSCTVCKMAYYCGKSCQTEEWKIHKLLHKELEITKEVLSKLELEESLNSSITLHTI